MAHNGALAQPIKRRKGPVTGNMTEEEKRTFYLQRQKQAADRRKLWYNIGQEKDLLLRLKYYLLQTYRMDVPIETLRQVDNYFHQLVPYFRVIED